MELGAGLLSLIFERKDYINEQIYTDKVSTQDARIKLAKKPEMILTSLPFGCLCFHYPTKPKSLVIDRALACLRVNSPTEGFPSG
jgi:hypothetical protein